MSGAALNTDPPGVRCSQCGGRCRAEPDPLFHRGARIITCASGHPGEGRCGWSSQNPGRIDPSWYWRLRVRLGI